jgi:hypothetical protein
MKLRLSQHPIRGAPSHISQALLPSHLIEALPAATWHWLLVGDVELWGQTGQSHSNLMEWHEQGAAIPTARLIGALADGYGIELSWGDLKAFEPGSVEPLITISGFDSTWYDVEGRDDLVGQLSQQFGWAQLSAD